MPNQRKADKKNVGGFIDKSLADKIASSGMEKTEFLEWASVRALLMRGRLTVTEIKKMESEGRLKAFTLSELRREGLLK